MDILKLFFLAFLLACMQIGSLTADDGYRLWLKYDPIADTAMLESYQTQIQQVIVQGDSVVSESIRKELKVALGGLLNRKYTVRDEISRDLDAALCVGSAESSNLVKSFALTEQVSELGDQGFLIRKIKYAGIDIIAVCAKTDIGALYGTYRLISLLQQHKDISDIDILDQPAINIRVLNHWDNWSKTSHGSVERGYAGDTLWQWDELPGIINSRYVDYARANASIGINGTVLNNVNAQTDYIKTENLPKVAALAYIFRAYGIKTYLAVRFDSPVSLGGLKTADPLDEGVRQWWSAKIVEIYKHVPDFGGFLVKGDSEGQPGPLEYDRSHADGANMLAKALRPYDGIVMWRTFVYGVNGLSPDRVKQGYEVFKPLDDQFADNVIVQAKNGPLDFQVREPVNPLFGQMTDTNLGIEFEITQEYTGTNIALCWLVPQWKEVFDFDTLASGKGSTVEKVVNGSLYDRKLTLAAGVANIGSDRNWTGHLLAQANWYGFGRLVWNPDDSAAEIASDWTRMTFSNESVVVSTVSDMLLNSWHIFESYTSPVGLGFMVEVNNRRMDPAPEYRQKYHLADKNGIGFDRSRSGNDYIDQYCKPLADKLNDPHSCPEEILLWIHHLPYDFKLKSGKTLIQEIYDSYFNGVNNVEKMVSQWEGIKEHIDKEQYESVYSKLILQLKLANKWKDVCTSYFQKMSGIPDDLGRVK